MSGLSLPTDLERTLHAVLDHRAETAPDAPFLVDPRHDTVLTYYTARAQARGVAAALLKRGFQPGDSIAFALTNGPEAAAVLLGLFYGGFRAVAVNRVAGPATIGYVLEHSESRAVIGQPAHEALLGEAMTAGEVELDIVSAAALLEHGTDATLPNPPAADDDGLLMYTSGTTGRPKGVRLTQANLVAGGKTPTEAHRLTGTDRALCVLPFYHINGLCVTLLAPLVSGGSVVMPERFSASGFWDLIRKHRCTWFSVVPTQISYLLHGAEQPEGDRHGLECVRFARSASAPLAPEIQSAFEDRFGIPVVETMGLTETAAQILSNPLPPGRRKIGSPGIAYGNEVIIADEAQRALPAGTEGEILVRGPNVMAGYLKNADATHAALTADGWLRTGDLGRMDADGYVFVTGRLKELIIKGGENIAPREIDEALYAHPAVVEAAAFARPCPDYGQRVEAGVAVEADAAVTEADLLGLCLDRLGAFKTPDRIHFLAELPKGPSGKIQRMKLADLVAGR